MCYISPCNGFFLLYPNSPHFLFLTWVYVFISFMDYFAVGRRIAPICFLAKGRHANLSPLYPTRSFCVLMQEVLSLLSYQLPPER